MRGSAVSVPPGLAHGSPSGTRTNVSVFLGQWGWRSLGPLDYPPGPRGPGACVLDRFGRLPSRKSSPWP